jgi:uncharacterized membrane protein YjgN (DUF898 family)
LNSNRASFVGSGSEYFRIWAVNIALVMLSFSLYRPWAKVRKLKYFARNTRLADASFDYHGDPIAIFKGQLLVLALFFVANLHPGLLGVSTAIGLALLPWVLQRSIGFRLRNTSYRNIRFGFDAPLPTFYATTAIIIVAALGLTIVFLWWPGQNLFGVKDNKPGVSIVMALSFFFALLPVLLLMVLVGIRFKSIPFSRWGNRRFDSSLRTWDVFKLIGVIIAVAALLLALLIALAFLIASLNLSPSGNFGIGSLLFLGAISIFTGYKAFIGARLHNIAWNDTQLGEDHFTSDLSELKYAAASIGVFWLTLISLGLYRPFGIVSLAKMQINSLQFHSEQSIDETMALADPNLGSAFGQEAADWFDIDIAF